MSLRTPTSGNFQMHPPGMFAATCYQIIDLGSHYDEKWEITKHLVRVTFETTELMADGRPFSIGKRYTLSHHEKSQMRKDLESWYGKAFNTKDLNDAGGFELSKILGRAAFLNIAHSEDGKYANIKSINPIPKGMTVPPAVNPLVLFSLEDFDSAVFNGFHAKLQEFINASNERTGKSAPPANAPVSGNAAESDEDSQVPF